jgi:hypothetical protein
LRMTSLLGAPEAAGSSWAMAAPQKFAAGLPRGRPLFRETR